MKLELRMLRSTYPPMYMILCMYTITINLLINQVHVYIYVYIYVCVCVHPRS